MDRASSTGRAPRWLLAAWNQALAACSSPPTRASRLRQMRRNSAARWPSFDDGSSGRPPRRRRDTVGALTPSTSASSFCEVSPSRDEARTSALLSTAPARAASADADGEPDEDEAEEDDDEDEADDEGEEDGDEEDG